jgi:hypothetical protein
MKQISIYEKENKKMKKYEYSDEIAAVVKQVLTEDNWRFNFDEKTGIFDFGLRIKSKIQKINYLIDVNEDSLVAYGFCPISVDSTDADRMARMVEFFSRANYGLINGCFEIDFDDGGIRFRTFVDCEGLTPSAEVVKNCIHCIAVMFKRYAPGIVDIIFTDGSAKDAIAKCEKSSGEELLRALRELGGDITDGDILEIAARLAERLGIDEETDEDVVEDLAGIEEIHMNPFDMKSEGGAAS